MKATKKRKLIILLVVLILPALWGLFLPGYFGVHDDMHPAWIFEMFKAFSVGQMPPRWASNLSFGFGYPLFHFVYPLPYYLGAFFYWLGMSLTGSVQVLHVLALVFSGIFMYLFAKEHWGKRAALMAGLLYVYTPYRALDVYVRGALGEAIAFVFLPLIGWGISKSCKTNRWRYVGVTAIAIACLILSHNLTAMAGLPILAVYCLLEIWRQRKKVKVKLSILRQTSSLLLGLIISAYFWLPAFVEKKLMIDDTLFNFKDHFPFIKQLIFSPWGHGASLWGPGDGMSFQVGIINWLVLISGGCFILYSLIKKKKVEWVAGYFALIAVLSLFLMNIRSSFLWDSLPLLAYFQFPWRLLIVTTFCSSFLAGFVASKIKKHKWLFTILLVSPIILTSAYFQPEKIKHISDEQIFTRFFSVNPTNPKEESKEYLTLGEEYLRLSKKTEERPSSYAWEKFVLTGSETEMQIKEKSSIDYLVETSGEENLLVTKIYALPGWQVEMDGSLIEIKAGKPYGQIEIEVPEGEHSFRVRYKQTKFWQIINIVSLIGFLIAIKLIVSKTKRVKK